MRVQEAPTHFASDRDRGETSLCGDFAEYSLPSAEFEPMRAFWEPLGFVALGETDAPYVRMSMTSDHIDLAVHRPRTLDQPMLVFAAADMGERIERLRSLDVAMSDDLPRGLDPRSAALLRAPEGTALLLDQRRRLALLPARRTPNRKIAKFTPASRKNGPPFDTES